MKDEILHNIREEWQRYNKGNESISIDDAELFWLSHMKEYDTAIREETISKIEEFLRSDSRFSNGYGDIEDHAWEIFKPIRDHILSTLTPKE